MTKIQDAKRIIEEADKIVIGAGAGLSAAAGLTYSGSRFEVFFKDYIARYGMQDMYSAAFYPFETAEERWGYWAKHIYHNRYRHPVRCRAMLRHPAGIFLITITDFSGG